MGTTRENPGMSWGSSKMPGGLYVGAVYVRVSDTDSV